MRLALDHHYSRKIAEQLRERGFDVVACVEREWQRLSDDALLSVCATERRALMTNNVADFVRLAREWQAQGRTHAGLVFTSDASLSRARSSIGVSVEALARLMVAHPGDDGFVDRVGWLGPSAGD